MDTQYEQVTIELAGLTKLDQMEIEEIPALQHAEFREERLPDGRLGDLPLLAMLLHASPEALAAVAGGIAVWLAKTRRRDELECSVAVTTRDGTSFVGKVRASSSSSISFESEVVELAGQLASRVAGVGETDGGHASR